MLVRCKNTEQILADAMVRFLESGDGIAESNVIARKLACFFPFNTFTAEMNTLSIREREVLELLSRGHLIKEIANQMGISFDTVRTYIRRIYQKLHVHSRTQAVAKYLRAVNVVK